MRKASDGIRKAMGTSRLGWAFSPSEKGCYEQRGDTSDSRCKGTAPVAVLNTHYRRKAGARNSSGSDFSSRGHCLHSGHILKAEPTASLVGLDTGREREVRGR